MQHHPTDGTSCSSRNAGKGRAAARLQLLLKLTCGSVKSGVALKHRNHILSGVADAIWEISERCGEEATQPDCYSKLDVNRIAGPRGCVSVCLRCVCRLLIRLIPACLCIQGLAGVHFAVCLINEEGQQRLSAAFAPQLASLYHSNST